MERSRRLLTIIIIPGLVATILLLLWGNDYRPFEGLQGPCWTSNLDDEIRYVQENFEFLHQNDPKLIRYTRARYLSPPPKSNVPYHFDYHPVKGVTDHGDWARKYFKGQRDGVFIEAGANDGEFYSHTLRLETDLGWTGLLIECNPGITPYLRTKQRKAWVAGVCISTTQYPKIVNFSNPEKWSWSGRLGPAWNISIPTNWTYFDVESVPLYTIIAATGLKEIDFFSFDVEGVEMQILKNFPFDKILIKVIVVEVVFITPKERRDLEKFLREKGYTTIKKEVHDHFYVHESVRDQYGE